MRDVAFKESVSNRTVRFQQGDVIVCVLHTERKLNPIGDIVVSGRYVSLVYEKKSATGGAIATAQGRKKRFEDKHSNAQGSLTLIHSEQLISCVEARAIDRVSTSPAVAEGNDIQSAIRAIQAKGLESKSPRVMGAEQMGLLTAHHRQYHV